MIMLNDFLREIAPGTHILVQNMDNTTVLKKQVLTIDSIKHYNKDLCDVTFKGHSMKGCYVFSMGDLIKMRVNYLLELLELL